MSMLSQMQKAGFLMLWLKIIIMRKQQISCVLKQSTSILMSSVDFEKNNETEIKSKKKKNDIETKKEN